MTKAKSKPRLAFSGTKPELAAGETYMTLRVGDKWARANMDGRKDVVLLDGRGKKFGEGTLCSVYYLPLCELRPEWLLFNYDPSYHTHAGALAGLRETYASCEKEERRQDVHATTMVSVVFFTVN
jgi:hypothetical protein